MAFAKNLGTVKLVDGTDIVLPRLTIGKVLAVSKSLATLVKKIKTESPDLMSAESYDPEKGTASAQVLAALPAMLPVVLEEVVDLVANYLGKDVSEVQELEVEDIIAIATPFFASILASGNKAMDAFNKAVPSISSSRDVLSPSEIKPQPAVPSQT